MLFTGVITACIGQVRMFISAQRRGLYFKDEGLKRVFGSGGCGAGDTAIF